MSELKLELPPEVGTEEARLLLSIKLYEMGRLSLGQAAELAGYSKRAYMEVLHNVGAVVFDHPAGELEEEVSS